MRRLLLLLQHVGRCFAIWHWFIDGGERRDGLAKDGQTLAAAFVRHGDCVLRGLYPEGIQAAVEPQSGCWAPPRKCCEAAKVGEKYLRRNLDALTEKNKRHQVYHILEMLIVEVNKDRIE